MHKHGPHRNQPILREAGHSSPCCACLRAGQRGFRIIKGQRTCILTTADVVAHHFQILETEFESMFSLDPNQALVNVKIVLSAIGDFGASVAILSGDFQAWKYPVLVYT